MKISIIGGGPAGLYFACSIKSLNPKINVVVYEARNESVNSFGLGYTMQSLGNALLKRLDENYFKALFPNGETPLITQALFKTNNDSRIFDFSDGFSVTRFDLMRYLHEKALSLNIKIKERKVTPVDIKRLKKSSDLLVGADGVNSIVKQQFTKSFKPHVHTAKLQFSWFMNETDQIRKEACFYTFQAPEGVIIMTSYPLTETKQVVIIEMSNQCANSGRLKGKSPHEAIPYLNEILSSNGDNISLTLANLPWYSFKMNTTKNLVHENVTLIGDGAMSFHYSAGQGLTSAFTMGYTLANCLLKNHDINTALQHYEHSLKPLFEKPYEQSLTSIKWFEEIDTHFQNTPEANWLEHFRLKDKFHNETPNFTPANTPIKLSDKAKL
ncbi:MAG: 2-polyprenyl-6-methoxyphenol hydroxylase-like FAD-dependent oxidoreductase [Oleiphilaceae bacterium]|jgi:2-polyprenyl-6-methoxyphenol hydroxylase-like FAD-dependent oxidoreductase